MATSELRDQLQQTVSARYRLGRELGRGGMATVYLAEDLRHPRRVAVKVLRPELAEGISADRFLREIEITAQLLHPHILPLLDSGTADGLLYYVMPFVEGESLRERLDREGELPIEDGVRIVREVADALVHAHERGIVHRDIKPENVLLTGMHALVADFGVAKALASARDLGRGGDTISTSSDPLRHAGDPLTSLGVALGTPAYMAPEQAAGDPHVDARADIYALGVLAYEVLAGAPPFTGPTAQHVMAAHLTRAPEPLSRVRPSVPAAIEALVMRCLEKRPADRWRSGEELLRRLETVVVPAAESAEAAQREPADHTFRLSERVCRMLDRTTLDPRMIGDVQHYLDNEVESPVLLCFLHGTGYDQRQHLPVLRQTTYRALAPTWYGFEPAPTRRSALGLQDHLVVLREFLRDARERLRPELLVLVGFSSGGDVAMRFLAEATAEDDRLVDGVVALGSNLSLETCFVTRLFARMGGDESKLLLADLRSLGAGAESLEDWLNIHEYLVTTLRKFHGDVAPLRRFCADIVRPFADGVDSPFAAWFRAASTRARRVRCVFEDTELIDRPLRELRLRNLDEGILGERYREDSITTEPGTDHFDLVRPELMLRHVEEMVRQLREG